MDAKEILEDYIQKIPKRILYSVQAVTMIQRYSVTSWER